MAPPLLEQLAGAPPEVHVPVEPDDREVLGDLLEDPEPADAGGAVGGDA